MATTTDVSSPVSVILSESDEDDIGGNNDFGSSEALNETNSTLTSSSKCKTGRFKSDIWALFTDTERPNQLKEVFCKHCKIKVHHHKKSELARQHLLLTPGHCCKRLQERFVVKTLVALYFRHCY